MITVDEALSQIFALARDMPSETVVLRRAAGRILAHTVTTERDQPPFAASAMDGYAICREDAHKGRKLLVIGVSAAGAPFDGCCAPGQAVRIFTGAPVPRGADLVVIQEDTDQSGDHVTLIEEPGSDFIRPAGQDFATGFCLPAPKRLKPGDIALLAAMGRDKVRVYRKPVVALLSTGDELCPLGQTPRPDQIFASNAYGLAALLEQQGAEARILPIAPDTVDGLRQRLQLAKGCDLVVTIGGASVGDHDLVAAVAEDMGLSRSFYKVRMRPGKPLLAGNLGDAIFIGLPGNPVSAMVCGHIFLVPLIDAMTGMGRRPRKWTHAPLSEELPRNGGRAHFMRAKLTGGEVRAYPNQDSALLSVFAESDCLICRPIDDPAKPKGAMVKIILLS